MRSPSSFWTRSVEDPSRIAVVDPDGSEVSAGSLLARGNKMVAALRAQGFEKGDGLAVILPNGSDLLAAALATAQAGWYLTCVNTHLTGPEIAYIVRDSGCRGVLVHERFAGTFGAAIGELDGTELVLVAVGAVDGCVPVDEFVDGFAASLPAERTMGGVMIYTSGTTGKPKGVRRPLADADPDVIFGMSGVLLDRFGAGGDDGVYLACGPLYHSAPFGFTTGALHGGQKVVLTDRWDPEDALALIDAHQVTATHMVPTMFRRLLALPASTRDDYDLSSLRAVVHAAAPCPPEVKRAMLDWLGLVVHEYYGSTELGIVSLITAEQWLTKPGSLGPPLAGTKVRILDDDGNDCPPGISGNVYVESMMGRVEYHNDIEKTQGSHRDGYFTVGDIGFLDDDGWLYLCDRKADVIISGGVNIYPAEVEAALFQHPAVVDAAVIGVPDEEWGERVLAIVQPTESLGDNELAALGSELDAHCRALIGGYKCPRSFDFRADLPRTDAGKLARRLLRDEYWNQADQQI